jgi:DNA helicase-2/ATP-dependent DNA helicase PcrA
MMHDKIFKGLNEQQIRAVSIIDGPVLVISGPGSGKTKCLTHRIANLIANNIRPENILAVTFTNKAAGEVKERVAHILNQKYPPSSFSLITPGMPMIGTFHSICLRILRREIQRLGYGSNFVVFDSDEQSSLIKRIMAGLEIDTKKFPPKAIASKISDLKTDLIEAENYLPSDFYMKLVSRVFKIYQSEMKRINALDFDDLIGLTVKLFRNHPETLIRYQDIWRYILVDEYQDTSYDQYLLIKSLAQKNQNIFCIGDDAQSIYQFRKADMRNILNFQKDYPQAKVIMLEQNYRSTKNIIAAAQEIISNNKTQIQKSLWTDNDGGAKILIKETLNEKREANFVVSKVMDFVREGYKLKDVAVLYRTHAQSRAIEEGLISNGLPYQIVGGTKFYERKEIKDILAYLKFTVNSSDLVSFERIINIPVRGIGPAAIEKITSRNQDNLIDTLGTILKDELLPKKQSQALAAFVGLIKTIQKDIKEKSLTNLIKAIVERISYEDYLKNLSTRVAYENFEDRIENLRELATVAKKYDKNPEKEKAVEQFLEEIALLQETDKIGVAENKITLMTAHASKGLEFPIIFVVGLEEGLFPQNKAITAPQELEEERRLCYVAVTRAKERLVLTYTRFRNIFGSLEVNLPSRFISEIPAHVADYHSDQSNYYEKDYEDFEEKIYY